MQQTLLALAAVFAFGYLALGRQAHDRSIETRAIGAEVELAATDLARARMATIEQAAFDEDDVGQGRIRTVPSDATIGPDAGEDAPLAYDDVDDWHGYDAPASVDVGVGTLQFRERVTVRYVEDRAPATPASGATLTKEIVVTVVEVTGAERDRPPAQASIRHVVTPVSLALARS